MEYEKCGNYPSCTYTECECLTSAHMKAHLGKEPESKNSKPEALSIFNSLYSELTERMEVLEYRKDTHINSGRINELQLVIIRIQKIMLDLMNESNSPSYIPSTPGIVGFKVNGNKLEAVYKDKEKLEMVWFDFKEKKPLCYRTGGWDGRKSDPILVNTHSGSLHLACAYEGILDGSEYFEFYDDRDFEIRNVKLWAEIDLP
jgi:hypothetical protein